MSRLNLLQIEPSEAMYQKWTLPVLQLICFSLKMSIQTQWYVSINRSPTWEKQEFPKFSHFPLDDSFTIWVWRHETEKPHLSWCIYVSKRSGAFFSKNTQKNSNINHIPVSLWLGLSGQSCTTLMISSLVLFKVANLVLIMLNFSTTSVTKISYPSLTTRTSNPTLTTRTSHPTSTTRTSHTILSTRASPSNIKN